MKTLALTLLVVTFLTACTRSENQTNLQLKVGQSLFSFDYQSASEILITKDDPKTGDRWTARIARTITDKSDEWHIQDRPLIDTRANGAFILHLLDTFRTLKITGKALKGPLESFGLAPPRFAIRWKASPGAKPDETFELRIGSGNYALAPRSDSEAITVEGAALKMLEHIDSFSALRERSWAAITSDEIDEIELKHKKRSYFYAQREGSDWTDRKHKKIKRDVSALLDGLTHARIEEFIDDPSLSKKLQTAVNTQALYEALLTDRLGNATRLAIAWDKKRLVGTTSSRPNGVFQLYTKIAEFFTSQR